MARASTVSEARHSGAKNGGTDLLRKLEDETRELLRGADQIIAKMVDEQPVSSLESAILERLKWDDRRIKKETSRLQDARRYQRGAATDEELEAGRVEAQKAAESLADAGPKLEKTIAEAQARLQELSDRAIWAESVVVGAERNRETLKTLVPGWIQRDYDCRAREIDKRFREIGSLEVRLGIVNAVSAMEWTDHLTHRRGMVSHCQSLGKDHPCFPVAQDPKSSGARGVPNVDLSAWETYRGELLEEKPKLEARLAELQKAKAAAMVEVDRLLEFYWPGRGHSVVSPVEAA